MVKVTFISADGSTIESEAEPNSTLLECAMNAMVAEIEGQCGGACACATCHCYPRDEWLGKLKPLGEFEECTLEGGIAEVKNNSRLACQIVLTEELSGMVVDLPADY